MKTALIPKSARSPRKLSVEESAERIKQMQKYVAKHIHEIVLEIDVRHRTGAFKKNPCYSSALAMAQGCGTNANAVVEAAIRTATHDTFVKVAKAHVKESKAEALAKAMTPKTTKTEKSMCGGLRPKLNPKNCHVVGGTVRPMKGAKQKPTTRRTSK